MDVHDHVGCVKANFGVSMVSKIIKQLRAFCHCFASCFCLIDCNCAKCHQHCHIHHLCIV
jgi:hypothetical protein